MMHINTETSLAEMKSTAAAVAKPLPLLVGALGVFPSILLGEIQDAKLLRRVSSKYLMTTSQLLDALLGLTEDYSILEINGQRMHQYKTLYFDTPDLTFYLQHHNGWRSRYKVRERTYLDIDLSYLEVKRKSSDGVTVKSRMRTPSLSEHLGPQAGRFVSAHCPMAADELHPTVWNTFRRITLVSRDTIERVTFDVDLTLGHQDAHVALPGIAIAELKQDYRSLRSRFSDQMRALGLRPMSFSKYCVAVAHFYPTMKHNAFKTTFRYLDALVQEGERSWKI